MVTVGEEGAKNNLSILISLITSTLENNMGAIIFLFICVIMVLDIANTIDKKHNPNRRK